jgi:hypothetical protein
MTEKPPSIENVESREQKMVRLFRERGIGDPEAMKLLIEWTQEREADNEKSKDPEARIRFELDRGDLYIQIGNLDGGFQAYEDARTMAWNEGREDIYKEIMEKLDRLDHEYS